ncbi:MAG: RNA polymerase sigma factor [Thermoguttaceae bacterium]
MFHTTHWTAVLAAKEDRAALMRLCETYYSPIRQSIEWTVKRDKAGRYGCRDADDLAQDFVAKILAGRFFEHLTCKDGRFRSYLLGAIRHFLDHVREKESAKKRDGNQEVVLRFPSDSFDDSIFDRDWAAAIISVATNRLKNEESNSVELLPFLTEEMSAKNRRSLAESLSVSEVAVKVRLHRLRKRFARFVRETIAMTIDGATPDSAETLAELDHLNVEN